MKEIIFLASTKKDDKEGVGAIIETPSGVKLGRVNGHLTDNKSDKTYLEVLRLALLESLTQVEIHCDSEEIVELLNSGTDINASEEPLFKEVTSLLDEFDSVDIMYTERYSTTPSHDYRDSVGLGRARKLARDAIINKTVEELMAKDTEREGAGEF